MYRVPSGPRRARLPARRRAAAACLLAAGAAWAEPAPTERIQITGTRGPQRAEQALAEVSVIERDRIDAATGRTLAELLAREAGIQFWSHGGLGKSASVSIRGLESRHTLLLVDGVRHGSATLGTPAWDNLPLDAIERIEIVRGPLSGLYGSDAVGGVVQVFTRRGAPGFRPDGTVTAGSHGHRALAAGTRFGRGAFDGTLRLQHLHADGISATHAGAPPTRFDPDDDGFQQTSAHARLGATRGPWRAEASMLAADGLTHFDDGPGVDSRAALRTEVLAASLRGPLGPDWRTTLRAAHARDAYDTLASASAFAALGRIETVNRQLSWEHRFGTPIGSAVLVAERTQQHVSRPGEPFAVSERRITGFAAGLDGAHGPHGWQANLRHDRNSQFGHQNTGSAAYGLALAPGLRAAVSYGSSFVAPSFNQLYYPGFGNPELQPEEGRQREFSLRWQAGGVTTRLAWFEHRIRGYISGGPQPANIPRTRIDGLTASVDAVFGPFDRWALAASLDSLDPVNASAGSAHAGNTLPRRVRDSARLALDWRGAGVVLGGTLLANGPRWDDAANTVRLGGYATLDLRAQWQPARAWTLALQLNNALGQAYETVRGYNQPGRELYLSLRYAAP